MNLLHTSQPYARWLLVPVVVVVATLAVQWWRAERALGASANPAKHFYLLSTAFLIVAVLVDPIAGFLGYVASHAVEYFVIVHRSVRSRAGHVPGVGWTHLRVRHIALRRHAHPLRRLHLEVAPARRLAAARYHAMSR